MGLHIKNNNNNNIFILFYFKLSVTLNAARQTLCKMMRGKHRSSKGVYTSALSITVKIFDWLGNTVEIKIFYLSSLCIVCFLDPGERIPGLEYKDSLYEYGYHFLYNLIL